MRARLLFSGLASTVLMTAALTAAAAQPLSKPRDEVAGVAAVIEANYFDAAKGKTIADGLRAAAAKGEFDALTDPRDLAQKLTERLQPLDHHFSVTLAPDGPGAGPGPGPSPGPVMMPAPAAGQEDPFDRRTNYGFRRADILPGNIGYIELREFADFDFDDPQAHARQAADAALQMVAHADAVIIDLRDNGGGSPAMVGYLASAFSPPGADIYNTFHTRGPSGSEAPAKPYPHPRLDPPLYILTSARTGSAAEALAYTLQSAGRAKVVGEASGGAANPGGRFPAGHGLAVFVSVGSPENPITHRNWEGDGVKPDVAAPAAQALDQARRLALEAIATHVAEADRLDNQWALEALKAEAAPPVAFVAADYVGDYGGAAVSATPAGLSYQRGRRPPWSLIALSHDLFTVAGEPARRIAFERGADGKVTALEIRGSDGSRQHLRRGG